MHLEWLQIVELITLVVLCCACTAGGFMIGAQHERRKK